MISNTEHLMNLCVLSSNGMVQKNHMPDPSPRLLKVKLNDSPLIMIVHMNTFACKGKCLGILCIIFFNCTLIVEIHNCRLLSDVSS